MISLRKRLLTALVTLVGVYSLVFCLARFLPADPSLIHLGERGSNVDRGRWLRSRNLQRPLGEQFFSFPLGKENLSLFRREPVRTLVLRSLPQTLSLALFSWILALIPAALLLPLPRMGGTPVPLSTPFPPLVSGSILMVVFSSWRFLPFLTLAIALYPNLYRGLKKSLQREQSRPYLLGLAKIGLPQRRIRLHLFRRLLPALLTLGALQVEGLLTGTIITETLFSRPGLGSLLAEAVRRRDYPLLEGLVLFLAIVTVLLNFIVDLALYLLDPRLRRRSYEGSL